MTLLLLADPASWTANVAAEACALGIEAPIAVATARDTIIHLAGGVPVCYLLVQPDRMGTMRNTLVEMTTGEADSPTRLILLGDTCKAYAIPGAIHADGTPGWLGRAMKAAVPPRDNSMMDDAALLDALTTDCLRASYQPIVSIGTRQPVGFEALARMHHPRRGMLSPSMFVPHAEASGMGWTLFRLLTAIVMEDWKTYAMERLDVPLSLNIAVEELLRPDLHDWMEAQCATTGISPSMVVLEMTETQPVQDTAALRAATNRLTRLGFTLMIDDVGPGLRDSADLMDLNFAGMKVDKMLISAASDNPEARQILTRLLDRARQAGLVTVAEGVEDHAAWERVRAFGFDRVQGFHAGRPLPAAAVATWHRAWTEPTHTMRVSSRPPAFLQL